MSYRPTPGVETGEGSHVSQSRAACGETRESTSRYGWEMVPGERIRAREAAAGHTGRSTTRPIRAVVAEHTCRGCEGSSKRRRGCRPCPACCWIKSLRKEPYALSYFAAFYMCHCEDTRLSGGCTTECLRQEMDPGDRGVEASFVSSSAESGTRTRTRSRYACAPFLCSERHRRRRNILSR